MTQFQPATADGQWLSEGFAADTDVETRADFIRKTYLHLLGAVMAFAVLEFLIFQLFDVRAMTEVMLGTSWSWLIVLGVYMAVSWVAERWASSTTSLPTQYLGLGVYVVAEAVIFVPLLLVAQLYGGPNVIPTAAMITGGIFAALTMVVFVTGADFSFLKGILAVGAIAALGVIVASILMGFTLGIVFTGLMIALAGGFIVYHTSNVVHHYRIGQHVAASLALFASVALLFWYVLRLLIILNQE